MSDLQGAHELVGEESIAISSVEEGTQISMQIKVETYQVIFDEEDTPYKFGDVEHVFDGMDFTKLVEKFKMHKPTTRLWCEEGEKVFRNYFPFLRLTNKSAQMEKNIHLYYGIAGNREDIERINIKRDGYLGVTVKSVFGRSDHRAGQEWKKPNCKSGRFRDDVVANGSMAYKFLKFVDFGEEALDPNVKYILEKCTFEFIRDVRLSSKLYNHNRAEKSYGGIIANYISNESERSQLGAFLTANLIGGRQKHVEGGMQSTKRSILLRQVEKKKEKRKFGCDLCSFSCPTRVGLNQHMTRHRTHKCDVCMKVFKAAKFLQGHMAHEHPKMTKYRCETCKVIFTRREGLDTHNATFHLPRPGEAKTCSICGGIFSSKIQVQKHLKNIHGKYFHGCKECDIFFGREKLKAHNEKHHKGKSGKFKCTICVKTCYRKEALDKHVRQQHTDIKWSCFDCRQNFSRRVNLQRHYKRFHN